jgi:dihydroorotate dehydrogenase (NAD+) catalytic subunit
MLNCVGLQNKGVDYFCTHIYPQLKDIDTRWIVNVSGSSPEDYAECAARIDALDGVPAIELNISCPNVKAGGAAFGTDCAVAGQVTNAVKDATSKPLMVKLSPNVTSITDIAKSVEANGADAVSLINTLLGMRIDIKTGRPILKNNVGGLSGPAVFPVAVRMVWQVANAVKIPVMGMGGVATWEDAVEIMMAGASAVQVGAAIFNDPYAPIKIIDGLEQYCIDNNIDNISQIVGTVKPW